MSRCALLMGLQDTARPNVALTMPSDCHIIIGTAALYMQFLLHPGRDKDGESKRK